MDNERRPLEMAPQQRLADIATYLRGVAAVVENVHRGAAARLHVAIQSLEAVKRDLEADHWEGRDGNRDGSDQSRAAE
jgi:hypothetical protein